MKTLKSIKTYIKLNNRPQKNTILKKWDLRRHPLKICWEGRSEQIPRISAKSLTKSFVSLGTLHLHTRTNSLHVYILVSPTLVKYSQGKINDSKVRR